MSERKSRKEKIADRELVMSTHPKGYPLDDNGQFYPDPTPIAPPIGYTREPSMWDIIREKRNKEFLALQAAGFETEEEANDFAVGDDYEPESPHELDEVTEVPLSVMRQRAFEAEIDRREAAAAAPEPQNPPATPPEVPSK